jgi:epoxide hydrolase-like predicted phosphatase
MLFPLKGCKHIFLYDFIQVFLMTKITTIIFDLGGVILNLNQELTYQAFAKLGADTTQFHEQVDVLNKFETGHIDADTFRNHFVQLYQGKVSIPEIDDAWNAMLLDLPEERINMLIELRKTFDVYLLSNTNSIHIDAFNAYLTLHHQQLNWMGLFDKVYYSYEIGYRKPNTDIYEFVLNDLGKQANECIFIDDNKDNLKGAEQVGIKTVHAAKPMDKEMFDLIYQLAN